MKEMQCVYCDVRTEILRVMQINFSLQRIEHRIKNIEFYLWIRRGQIQKKHKNRPISLWDLPMVFRVALCISVAKQRRSKQRALISDVDNMHGRVFYHKQFFERTSSQFAESNKRDSVPLVRYI